MDRRTALPNTSLREERRVVLESIGANVMIRPAHDLDRACTMALADVINAASVTDTCVVIDPEPIRCDDSFAAFEVPVEDRTCSLHPTCRPSDAEFALAGIIRLHAEATTWLVDVDKGRFCQLDTCVDPRFLGDEAWTPVVAVCITPTRLIAVGVDGTRTSANRGHPALLEQRTEPYVDAAI